MSEARWARTAEEASRREAAVLAWLDARARGLKRRDALASLSPPTPWPTLEAWIRRYRRDGVLGLIDQRAVRASPPQAPTPRKPRPTLSFLRWAGGKSLSLRYILPQLPPTFTAYYEPMVGAGHLFLRLGPAPAVLADVNAELMTCFEVIRDDVDTLVRALAQHDNTKAHYLAVRALDPLALGAVDRAARMIFLNQTGFNGIYRVNARGQFNVPYGHRPNGLDAVEQTLRRVNVQLQGVTLRCGDFAATVADAPPGSLIYFDPPYYRPLSAATGRRSTRLYRGDFGAEEHARLARVVRELDARGCHVLVSNSDAPLVRELYAGYRITPLRVYRPVNSATSGRGDASELLISNAPAEQLALAL